MGVTEVKSSDWLAGAIALADKRENACKNAKPCPKCGTNQVQIIGWFDKAQWRCRHCKHVWETANATNELTERS